MPLVWAHGEFVKLCYSHELGRPVDRPAATWARYKGARPAVDYTIWGPKVRPRRMLVGHKLTVALLAPARVRCGTNGWKDVSDLETRDTGLGVHIVDLPCEGLTAGQTVQFTFFWTETQTWEGVNYEVVVAPK